MHVRRVDLLRYDSCLQECSADRQHCRPVSLFKGVLPEGQSVTLNYNTVRGCKCPNMTDVMCKHNLMLKFLFDSQSKFALFSLLNTFALNMMRLNGKK